MANKQSASLDWITIAIYVCLVLIGFFMIYAVEYRGDGSFGFGSMGASATKQLIWAGISFVFMTSLITIEWKIWRTFAEFIYVVALVLLVLVLFFGSKINGARAWFNFGGFSFQPAEIAKFGTCLALSNFLSAINTDIRTFKHQIQAVGFIMLPVCLILLQPDAGSGLVFMSFFILLYRAGFPPMLYVAGLSVMALFIASLMLPIPIVIAALLFFLSIVLTLTLKYNYVWQGLLIFFVLCGIGIYFGYYWEVVIANIVLFLLLLFLQVRNAQIRVAVFTTLFAILGSGFSYAAGYFFFNVLMPHQQERINVWLHPELCDPKGSLYNLLQSKLAIGSGGLVGKGFLGGTMTKLNYVPQQSTDFIFCTIGEEQGFLGSFSIILLYLVLLYRISLIAEKQKLAFARYYAYGVAGIFFVHVFVNIGMTMGLLPIIGIPLPFISYGGSSMLGFTLLLGVLLKLDYGRQVRS
ncbi:MAG: rod shape-determining protein RodA [Saprospiraceae bacterium]|nr:rod shape-determining protein RodA [Saprospiraceae bacterium]